MKHSQLLAFSLLRWSADRFLKLIDLFAELAAVAAVLAASLV